MWPVQNPVIEPVLCGWSDDASGIDHYHVEVYYMNIAGTGQLEETGTPLHSEDIQPPHNSFWFTCQTSGVYSIQLTVYDRANNSARARQLFSYDGNSKMTSTDCLIILNNPTFSYNMCAVPVRACKHRIKSIKLNQSSYVIGPRIYRIRWNDAK